MTSRQVCLLAVSMTAALVTASLGRAAPIAYWTFDAVADDSIGANHGALNGNATYSFLTVPPALAANGNIASLELDGLDASFFNVAAPSGSVSGTYTVSTWANIRSDTNAGGGPKPNNLLSTRLPGETSFDMKLENTNNPPARVFQGVHGDIGNGTGAWGNTAADYSFAYNQNQWYHVAYVVTPANWKVYVDGVQRATGSYNPEVSPLLWDSNHQISIGRYGAGGAGESDGEPTNGFIDDMSVFNYALPASQIAALAAGTSPLAIAPTPRKAGALNYISINSDADSQIDSSKTYTHALDFGSGPAANVNGVQFDQNFPAGTGSTNLPLEHVGNPNYNGLGAVGSVFEDMRYNAGQGVITLDGLTVGQTYDTRLYVRRWATNSTVRPNSIEFDLDSDGMAEKTVRINEDNAAESAPGLGIDQAYALSYTFTAEAPTMTIRANQTNSTASFHLYGLTNEVTARRPVETVFSTGLDAIGGRLPGGAPDPHYALVSAPEGTTAVAASHHGAWGGNDASSSWIGINATGITGVAVGEYRYRTSFDLAQFDSATAELVMSVFADNSVTGILLNGVDTGLSNIHPAGTAFNYAGGKTFKLNSGFLPGVNTLEFVMTNDTSIGPAGLRVELSGTAMPIPEPSSYVLAAMGAAALVAIRRRRRTAAA